MSNSTRIFVSSSSQVELQTIRQKLNDSLKEAGHYPLLFENNGFGLYSSDSIEDCLKKVRECDVFILIISDKAGSLTKEDPNITVTYAEYTTALAQNKLIIPVIDSKIYKFYTEHLQDYIWESYNNYRQEFDSEPQYTHDIVKEVLNDINDNNTPLANKLDKINADDFIWSFVFDVYDQTNWTYNYSIGESEEICEFVKEALSKVLQEVVPYYNNQYEVNKRLAAFESLSNFKESVPLFLQCINNGELNLKLFLKTLKDYIHGGEIQRNASAYMHTPLTTISDCTEITLYKKFGDKMELMDYIGSSPEAEFKLRDPNSFVSSTYNKNMGEIEHIFYSEEKQTVYLTKKIGELVLSCLVTFYWAKHGAIKK
ncbi:DUF4062 domain-containing protein [Halalkalibacter lacteus]|uniref:DUF4062 domain-containing protein n=1 Tax=Halalkalibacter lacteus TaxID=3090663 RepID=UPI002FCB2676